MAYATYEELVHSLDENVIAELCTDSGVPVVGDNAIIQAAIETASAIVRSYILVGGVYTDTDIADLVGTADPLLVLTTTALTAEQLFQRRGFKITPAIEQRVKQAYSMLESLRDGKMLFGDITRNQAAGAPAVKTVNPVMAFYQRVSASGFFPSRSNNTWPT